MKIRIGFESLDLELRDVVIEVIPHQARIENVIENDSGLEADSKRRYVGADTDAGEGSLIGSSGGGDIPFVVEFRGSWLRGYSEGLGRVRRSCICFAPT